MTAVTIVLINPFPNSYCSVLVRMIFCNSVWFSWQSLECRPIRVWWNDDICRKHGNISLKRNIFHEGVASWIVTLWIQLYVIYAFSYRIVQSTLNWFSPSKYWPYWQSGSQNNFSSESVTFASQTAFVVSLSQYRLNASIDQRSRLFIDLSIPIPPDRVFRLPHFSILRVRDLVYSID